MRDFQMVLTLSFDHKPKNDVELCHIKNNDGFVRIQWVDGDLVMSRGFINFEYNNCRRGVFIINHNP